MCNNFSRSPSINLDTGIPVQRPTIRAISSSVTLSRNNELLSLDRSAFASSSSSCFFKDGNFPYFNSAALFRS